jgi:hypothetical protein
MNVTMNHLNNEVRFEFSLYLLTVQCMELDYCEMRKCGANARKKANELT